MEILQQVLVYLTVALASWYLLKKFFLPKTLIATKKTKAKACGQDDCGCH